MKMFVYGMREFDERAFFEACREKYGIGYAASPDKPTLENAHLAEGYEVINILTAPVDQAMLDRYRDMGIRCIMTRTIGTDHIDTDYAEKKGIDVRSITYSPAAVADYAVMMILMGIRRLKYMCQKASVQDYTICEGILGSDLRALTVGIVGTGRIGACLAAELTGFGCRMLAYDPYPSDELQGTVEYTDMDTLLKESDVISLHAPATPDTYHILDGSAFGKMKAGAGLVNCARGALVDTDALIEAIETGHLAFACLDTAEEEYGIFYANRMGEPLSNRQLAILNSFPNVIVTPHMAFYTRQVIRDMVENSFIGVSRYFGERGSVK